MNNFEKQAHFMHEQNAEEYRKKAVEKARRGEPIYTEFCLWCNAFCGGKGQNDARHFGKWLKAEGITLTEEQRRWIGENKFGYKFVFKDGAWVREK